LENDMLLKGCRMEMENTVKLCSMASAPDLECTAGTAVEKSTTAYSHNIFYRVYSFLKGVNSYVGLNKKIRLLNTTGLFKNI
jgi:hypothetical protein